jgi:hypothetical protein
MIETIAVRNDSATVNPIACPTSNPSAAVNTMMSGYNAVMGFCIVVQAASPLLPKPPQRH